MNLDGTDQINLTNSNGNDRNASFSYNGEIIVFESDRDGNKEVYIMNKDGSNQLNISNHDSLDHSAIFSTDGLGVTWVSNRDGNKEIYLYELYESYSVINLTKSFGSDENITHQPNFE